jgi:hypothetical protein
LPWDPSVDSFASQEYAEDQLNQLMQKYKENEDNKNEMFRNARLKNNGKLVDGEAVSGEVGAAIEDAPKDTFEPMFGGEDLALARKAEAAAAAASDTTKDKVE